MEKQILTAQQVYEKLIQSGIKSTVGQITFKMCDLEVAVTTSDAVGSVMENWVKQWLENNNVAFDPNPDTQKKPDLYLNPADHKHGLVEIKAFNGSRSPAFDIADFVGFSNELIERPYLLEIECLVFAYVMNVQSGEIKIKDIWLRYIWELANSSKIWPLHVQGSGDKAQIKKIRPGNWFSKKAKYKTFESKLDFLSAYEQTLYEFGGTRTGRASNWRHDFINSYKNYYGEELIIPRWDDIKSKYI